MELDNRERILLLKMIREEIRKGILEKNPKHKWNGSSYKKPRKQYGLSKMTTLYELESKLITVKC